MSGFQPGETVIITRDVYDGSNLAFASGEKVALLRDTPLPDQPQFRYEVYSERLSKSLLLTDDDISPVGECIHKYQRASDGSLMCIKCGRSTTAKGVPLPAKTDKCSYCGAELQPTDVICGYCGCPDATMIKRCALINEANPKKCKHDVRFVKDGMICIHCAETFPLKTPQDRKLYSASFREKMCIHCGAKLTADQAICGSCGQKYEKGPELAAPVFDPKQVKAALLKADKKKRAEARAEKQEAASIARAVSAQKPATQAPPIYIPPKQPAQPTEPEQPAKPKGDNYCQQCGAELTGSKFCEKCGVETSNQVLNRGTVPTQNNLQPVKPGINQSGIHANASGASSSSHSNRSISAENPAPDYSRYQSATSGESFWDELKISDDKAIPFPEATWDIKEAMIIFAIDMVFTILLYVFNTEGNVAGSIISLILGYIALLGCTLYLVLNINGGTLSDLGWKLGRFKEEITTTFAVGFVVFLLASISIIISKNVILPDEGTALIEVGRGGFPFFSFFIGVIIAPIFEETYFRGCLYPVLRNKWNLQSAIIVNGLIFAAWHLSGGMLSMLIGFIARALGGMALCYLYEKTGSLYSSMTCHALYNGAIELSTMLILG